MVSLLTNLQNLRQCVKPGTRATWPGLLIGLALVSACSELTGSSASPAALALDSGPAIAPAEDRHLGEEQRARYRQDAEKLAVRYVNKRDSTRTEIPAGLVDNLYHGLIHIVNSGHPKAREATEVYTVHARTPSHSRQITVYADTTAGWIGAWRDEQTETGHEEVDQLIDRFNFKLVAYHELEQVSPVAAATLQADRPINVYAVGRLFEALDDIKRAGPDALVGDGADIEVLFFSDRLRYSFEFGFGDCPAGCISRHIWNFTVHRDGSVEFAGEKGPLPEG